jgi:hypothetical protein
MKGVEFSEVRDAVLGSFSSDEFDMFLFERFDYDRPVHVGDGPFKVVVSNVLKGFMQEGTDALLIAEVAAARPLKSDVQDVYIKYASQLVNESRQAAVSKARLDAMERYGLMPKVTLQKAGAPQIPAAASALNAGLERKVRADIPMLDVAAFRAGLFAMEGRVCRIEIGENGGTGFLVGPDAVLTNHHVMADVIDGRQKADDVQFRFDFKRLSNGLESDGVLAKLAKDWLIDKSPPTPGEEAQLPNASDPTQDELDFALVRLDRKVGDELPRTDDGSVDPNDRTPRGWVPVPTAAPLLTNNMPVLILQHPKGNPLTLAMDTQGVLGVRANRLRYATNTERGSSGSPVFDINWKLIALHHYGDPAYGHLGEWNQGIPIARIRERLSRVGKLAALGGLPRI